MPIALVAIVLVGVSFVRSSPTNSKQIAYSDVLAAARSGTLQSVTVRGEHLDIRLSGDDTKYSSTISPATDIARNLQEAAIATVEPSSSHVSLVFQTDRPSSWSNWAAFFLQFGVAAVAVYAGVYFAMRHALNKRDAAS